MEKLISMRLFVEQKRISTISTTDIESVLTGIFKYEMFLQQPLTLGMFVPCDLDGNVLEDPDRKTHTVGEVVPNELNYRKILKEYQEAKERCLFEGFEIKLFISGTKYLEFKDGNILCTNQFGDFKFRNYEIVEDLVKYDLVLTQTAQKQIGL